MKDRILGFLKPRPWTIMLTLVFLAWQYIYGYRGVDISFLSQLKSYFGAGLTIISWNNFFIRSFSLGLIWILVAIFIFVLLWLAENYVVVAHNRKITKTYANQSHEGFAHLLKTRDLSFKKHFVAQLWFSAFIILIPVGLIYLSVVLESMRSSLIISYVVAVQESGSEIDYNGLALVASSFLAMLPLWYLYSCFDTICYIASRQEKVEARIEDDHYAVPVITPTSESGEFDRSDLEEDSNIPASPVI